jgi:quinohemoprotein ethanol dehydrogenase
MLYVLDAKSGELLSADAFTEVNWNTGVDMKTGRPIEVKGARYPVGKPFNLAPGVQGGHGWHSNAYSPDTGLVYIATQRAYFPMIADPNYKPSEVGYNLGLDFGAQFTFYRDKPKAPQGFVGYLQAWDPVARKKVWESATNASPEGSPPGTPGNGPTGGALATAGGLVFAGDGSKGTFRAYDAKTGTELWSFNAQTGVLPGAISYELDGKQYIAASVGGNNASGNYYAPNYSRMLVFSLEGKATLPANIPFTAPPLDPPAATASADVVASGAKHYTQFCSTCHGQNGVTRGATFPNLMLSGTLKSQEDFDQIVLAGIKAERGMASFAAVLKAEDAAAIRAYVIDRANDLKNNPPPAFGPPAAAAPPPPRQQPRQAHEDPTK